MLDHVERVLAQLQQRVLVCERAHRALVHAHDPCSTADASHTSTRAALDASVSDTVGGDAAAAPAAASAAATESAAAAERALVRDREAECTRLRAQLAEQLRAHDALAKQLAEAVAARAALRASLDDAQVEAAALRADATRSEALRERIEHRVASAERLALRTEELAAAVQHECVASRERLEDLFTRLALVERACIDAVAQVGAACGEIAALCDACERRDADLAEVRRALDEAQKCALRDQHARQAGAARFARLAATAQALSVVLAAADTQHAAERARLARDAAACADERDALARLASDTAAELERARAARVEGAAALAQSAAELRVMRAAAARDASSVGALSASLALSTEDARGERVRGALVRSALGRQLDDTLRTLAAAALDIALRDARIAAQESGTHLCELRRQRLTPRGSAELGKLRAVLAGDPRAPTAATAAATAGSA